MKAFLFDMDGVIIDNERAWTKYEHEEMFPSLFGEEIAKKMGVVTGLSLEGIYDRAVDFGFKMDKEEYVKRWDKAAEHIYKKSKLTAGINEFAQYLIMDHFKLGLVSASSPLWIGWVLDRINFKDQLEVVISLYKNPKLKHKPAPDGYLEAMKRLDATPETSIVLEDSNAGIAAGKAAGAYVIGFAGNLVPGYKQSGADVYAKSMKEVHNIVKDLNLA